MVKLSLALSLAMAAMVNLPGSTQAAPMATCEDQSSCIKFEKELIKSGTECSSGGCEWKVCATLNQNDSRCVKDGAISHTCVKPDDTCSTDNGFSKTLGVKEVKSGLDDGYKQCQIVKGGAKVEFLFKDGKGCAAGGTATSGDFSCEPRDADTNSCTGNGVGVECIWSTTVPECTDDDSGSDGDGDSTGDDSGSGGDDSGSGGGDDSGTPCTGFSSMLPYKAPEYVADLWLDAPKCTTGPGGSSGYWVCRTVIDADSGAAQTFSACVAGDKFIKSDKPGCCGECPTPCGCACQRLGGGDGVLIQKVNDPNCLKCYAPYGAFRKIGLSTGYECATDCVVM